jgi:hypothetical protein
MNLIDLQASIDGVQEVYCVEECQPIFSFLPREAPRLTRNGQRGMNRGQDVGTESLSFLLGKVSIKSSII